MLQLPPLFYLAPQEQPRLPLREEAKAAIMSAMPLQRIPHCLSVYRSLSRLMRPPRLRQQQPPQQPLQQPPPPPQQPQ